MTSFDRNLREVDLMPNSKDQCELTSHVDTITSGETTIATGTMFAVTAKGALDILSFEFSHASSDQDLRVEIYTITGSDYQSVRNNRQAWTLLSQTTAAASPDEGDEAVKIAPRADIDDSSYNLKMSAGESRSFYFTLKSQHLRLEESSDSKSLTTGAQYFSDSMLQIDVGIGIPTRDFPDTPEDTDRAFQGRIHYRTIQGCSNFMTTSKISMPFAVSPVLVPSDTNDIFQKAFQDLLITEEIFGKWALNHELQLSRLQTSTNESKEDCTAYGIDNGCIIYDNTLSFEHYESLTSKEIELELITTLEQKNRTLSYGGEGSEMMYTGPQLLMQNYWIDMIGFPVNTILNPLQRDYIGAVTLDTMEQYSTEKPHLIDVKSQRIARRMQGSEFWLRKNRFLRGSVVTVEAIIYGIGTNKNDFFEGIEIAISRNRQAYLAQLKRQQYRPGPINDGTDFGAIFKDLIDVRLKTDVMRSGSTSDDVVHKEYATIWIIVCSITAALSFFYLVYRVYKDCLSVEVGQNIEKGEKLSERKERKKSGMDDSKRPLNFFYGWRTAKPNPETKASENAKAKTALGSRQENANGSPLGTVKESLEETIVKAFLGSSNPNCRSHSKSKRAPSSTKRPNRLKRSNSFSGIEDSLHLTRHILEDSALNRSVQPKRGIKRSNSFSNARKYGNKSRIESNLNRPLFTQPKRVHKRIMTPETTKKKKTGVLKKKKGGVERAQSFNQIKPPSQPKRTSSGTPKTLKKKQSGAKRASSSDEMIKKPTSRSRRRSSKPKTPASKTRASSSNEMMETPTNRRRSSSSPKSPTSKKGKELKVKTLKGGRKADFTPGSPSSKPSKRASSRSSSEISNSLKAPGEQSKPPSSRSNSTLKKRLSSSSSQGSNSKPRSSATKYQSFRSQSSRSRQPQKDPSGRQHQAKSGSNSGDKMKGLRSNRSNSMSRKRSPRSSSFGSEDYQYPLSVDSSESKRMSTRSFSSTSSGSDYFPGVPH